MLDETICPVCGKNLTWRGNLPTEDAVRATAHYLAHLVDWEQRDIRAALKAGELKIDPSQAVAVNNATSSRNADAFG